ncbi:MAG: SPFH domain-containing protein [Propionibacteriaceae bacterium]|jgi:membrane protease subunit (stomatin/prohibitin family)|nr:SPFH domain-containing protein [Propionibacteriaceae bacterium]
MMGLIKAATGALGGALADSWRDFFVSESLDPEVLLTKGQKRAGGRSSNKKGTENVISSGSVVVVNQGQCAFIVQQGMIVELVAEPGEFVWDNSTEPSLFYGDLSAQITTSFERLAQRLTFGGEPGVDQRIYYVNTKEITGNRFGTANPIPFRVVDQNIGLDVDISIRCNGVYSYRITDPIMFYSQVAGNVEQDYRRDQIDAQLKAELLAALQPALAKISALGIRYSALPGHGPEIQEALNEVLSQQWGAARGLTIASVAINSATASPEDEAMIKQLQSAAVMRNPSMAAANIVAAQADAMRSAAQNAGGAMVGFAGLGMAQQAGAVNAQDLFALGQAQAQQAQAAQLAQQAQLAQAVPGGAAVPAAADGAAAPVAQAWTCPQCGTSNTGKFCTNCGAAKPAGAVIYVCSNCGWAPPDPTHPPKFCANCGDPFDAADARPA